MWVCRGVPLKRKLWTKFSVCNLLNTCPFFYQILLTHGNNEENGENTLSMSKDKDRFETQTTMR